MAKTKNGSSLNLSPFGTVVSFRRGWAFGHQAPFRCECCPRKLIAEPKSVQLPVIIVIAKYRKNTHKMTTGGWSYLEDEKVVSGRENINAADRAGRSSSLVPVGPEKPLPKPILGLRSEGREGTIHCRIG